MEELTKTQFLLLIILVTFVVSIATGIITSSLLSSAPSEVTQTINRVVERTVERVVPSETVTSGGKETVVVTDEDLILSAVEKNSKNLVKIVRTSAYNLSDVVDAGLGLVVSKGNLVIAADKVLTTNSKYEAVFSDGKKFSLSPLSGVGQDYGLTFFKVDKDSKVSLSSATISSSDVKLGQTVVSISGLKANAVLVGRVSKMNYADDGSTLKMIETDIRALDSLLGTPIIGLSGDIAGLRADGGENNLYNVYLPARVLRDLVSQAEKII